MTRILHHGLILLIIARLTELGIIPVINVDLRLMGIKIKPYLKIRWEGPQLSALLPDSYRQKIVYVV